MAVGRWAEAAAVEVATAEAAAVVTVRRGTEVAEAPEATPGTARPLMLKPVPA